MLVVLSACAQSPPGESPTSSERSDAEGSPPGVPFDFDPNSGWCSEPVELPDSILVSEEAVDVSGLVVADLDEDRCLDVVFLVVEPSRVVLTVAWGSPQMPFVDRFEHTMLQGSQATISSDAKNLVAPYDLNRDGRLDLVTAQGLAIANDDREFEWRDNAEPPAELWPVGVIRLDEPTVIRGTETGVEACDRLGACTALDGFSGPVHDMEVADIDDDGTLDVLAVGPWQASLVYWTGSSQLAAARELAIPAVEFELSDVDRDKDLDVIAWEAASDSRIYLNAAAQFSDGSVIPDFHDQADATVVSDMDGDLCPDYVQLGASLDALGLLRGGCPANSVEVVIDASWETIPVGTSGIAGVQSLDLNGDGKRELVARARFAEGVVLRVLAPPAKVAPSEDPPPDSTELLSFTSSEAVAIPDAPDVDPPGDRASSTISVSAEHTVQSIEVHVSIEHEYTKDLSIELIAPDGSQRVLLDVDSDEMNDLSMRSFSIDSLAGRQAQGDWTLVVIDHYPTDAGQLLSWSITFP